MNWKISDVNNNNNKLKMYIKKDLEMIYTKLQDMVTFIYHEMKNINLSELWVYNFIYLNTYIYNSF